MPDLSVATRGHQGAHVRVSEHSEHCTETRQEGQTGDLEANCLGYDGLCWRL